MARRSRYDSIDRSPDAYQQDWLAALDPGAYGTGPRTADNDFSNAYDYYDYSYPDAPPPPQPPPPPPPPPPPSGGGGGGGRPTGTGPREPGERGQIPNIWDPSRGSRVVAEPNPDSVAFDTGDVTRMAEQNRLAARQWGQTMDQDLLNYLDWQNNLETNYLDWLLYGQGGYRDIFEGAGGFAPWEQEDLLQEDLLYGSWDDQGNYIPGALASPGELDELLPTDVEQQQWMGSPWDARDIYAGSTDPETGEWRPGMADWLVQVADETQAREREAFGPGGYLEDPIYGSIDENRLSQDPGRRGETMEALGNAGLDLASWLGPELSLSPEFTNAYRITDRDLQNIKDEAGRGVGLRTQAENEEIDRMAFEAGNTNPTAIAAARNRRAYTGEQAKSAAMLDAEMRARNLQLQTERDREAMRLQAEGQRSGFGIGAAQYLSEAELNALAQLEAERVGSERDISNRLMRAGETVGGARLASETRAGERLGDVARDVVGTTTGLTQQAESEQARRNQERIAYNQAARSNRLATRFGQYMPASQQLSARYGGIYGQKKGEEAEGRNLLSGLQGRAQQAGQTARQQRIAAGTGYLSSLTDPLSAISAWESRPRMWERIGGLVVGGLGAATGMGGG